MNWLDIIVGVVLLVGAFKSFKVGFVAELMGVVALTAAVVGSIAYGGFWDGAIAAVTHLGPGSSRAVGMIAFGALLYVIVVLLGFFLGRIVALPILKTSNALLGAGVGFIKAMVFIWAVLYVAMLFPLTDDVRRDLHQSTMVALLTLPNDSLDGKILDSLPEFARFFMTPILNRHRV